MSISELCVQFIQESKRADELMDMLFPAFEKMDAIKREIQGQYIVKEKQIDDQILKNERKKELLAQEEEDLKKRIQELEKKEKIINEEKKELDQYKALKLEVIKEQEIDRKRKQLLDMREAKIKERERQLQTFNNI